MYMHIYIHIYIHIYVSLNSILVDINRKDVHHHNKHTNLMHIPIAITSLYCLVSVKRKACILFFNPFLNFQCTKIAKTQELAQYARTHTIRAHTHPAKAFAKSAHTHTHTPPNRSQLKNVPTQNNDAHNKYLSLCVHISTYIHECTQKHARTHTHTHTGDNHTLPAQYNKTRCAYIVHGMHTHKHTHTNARVCARAGTHTHMYAGAHTHAMHIYIYTEY